jgi:hypothetical protein
MARKFIVGVMGPGEVCPQDVAKAAYEIGALIAKEGWVALSGGRDIGVMDAVLCGAKEAGGLTVGILPHQQASVSKAVDIVINTDVNMSRNNINVITSDVVVSCGIGIGTASEIALALNAKKKVIMLYPGEDAIKFFTGLRPQLIVVAESPQDVIKKIKEIKKEQQQNAAIST